jgi:hypothetical protein
MFSTTPVGILENSTGPSEILIVDPGAAPSTPAPWTTTRFGSTAANYPNFSLDALFGVGNPNGVRLAAISTGNDQIPPFSEEGQLLPFTYDLWFGLTVSVSNASTGISTSHPARVSAGGADSPGSELFTYYVEQSQGIDPSLVHTTVSERSRETLGLVVPPNTPPAARVDVRGLDHGLGVIAFDRNGRAGNMFEQRNRFYFTLEPVNLASYPQNFAIAQGDDFTAAPSVGANAATIYESKWDTDANQNHFWTTPRVYRTPEQLGLDPQIDSIDALSVDQGNGQIIFSTQVKAGTNQILAHKVINGSSPMLPKPLKTHDGVLMTVHLGLIEPDDVDGSCGIDPEANEEICGVVGIPWDPSYLISSYGTPLGISLAHVDAPAPATTKVEVEVTGLSPTALGGALSFYLAMHWPAMQVPLPDPGVWMEIAVLPLGPNATKANLTFPITAGLHPVDLAVTALQWGLTPGGLYMFLRPSWVTSFRLK